MTTKVTVSENRGWPVEVVPVSPKDIEEIVGQVLRVPAGETRDFYVHSGQDLLIHEIQPHEIGGEEVW